MPADPTDLSLTVLARLPDGDRAVAVHLDRDAWADGSLRAADLAAALLGDDLLADGLDLVVDGGRHPGATPLRALDLLTGSVVAPVIAPPRGGDRSTPTLDDRTGAIGTRPWHRAPRPTPPAPQPPPPAPPMSPAVDGSTATPLPWAAVLGPMALGGVAALVLGPQLAWLGLLGPVVVVGGWLEQRLRAHRRRARSTAAAEAERRRHHQALGRWWAEEVRRVRAAHPGPRRLADRAIVGDGLWARRPGHPDAGVVRMGTVAADVEADDRVEGTDHDVSLDGGRAEPADVPITVALVPGAVVGIVGSAEARRSLGRALVAAHAVLHGPADASIAIRTVGPRADAAWRWCRWLPHRLPLPAGRTAGIETGPVRRSTRLDLLVVDADPDLGHGPSPTSGRPGGEDVATLVLAPTTEQLPAGCTAVVVTDGCRAHWSTTVDAACDSATPAVAVVHPALAPEPGATPFVPDGLDAARAEVVARRLARFHDPDDRRPGARDPGLDSLLGLEPSTGRAAEVLGERWAAAPTDALATVIGSGPDGPVVLDLVADGPHALIAGTTGAGKSELLRTLITGWAVAAGPDRLSFLLVDFKGGAAFDACDRLPHTVGVVTDLDDGLAERVLVALDAEVARRERVLRAGGASRLEDLDARVDAPPLGRLVVVVDELATLVAEVPGAVDRLVDLGRRGRSLGVHLVLATQRPAGVVTDQLRANVSLRIALRVTDRADAVDVVGVSTPAELRADEPGRFVVRAGAGAAVTGRVAPASARWPGTPLHATTTRAAVRVHPAFEAEPPAAGHGADPGSDAPTVLEVVTEAARDATRRRSLHQPNPPWHPPLPVHLDRDDLAAANLDLDVDDPSDGGGTEPLGRPELTAVLGLGDDPSQQWQGARRWRPDRGHLVVHGVAGSGTTTTLVTAALDLARQLGPAHLHLYAADAGRDLAALEALPHTGAVVRIDDHARLSRLVGRLDDERRRRLQTAGEELARRPRVVLLVDGLAACTAALADQDHRSVEALQRVWADGAGVGIHLAVVAHQVTDVGPARAAHVGGRVVLRLADRYDLAALGLPIGRVPRCAGRGVDELGRAVQVAGPGARAARTAEQIERMASRWAAAGGDGRGPQPLTGLPARVTVEALSPAVCDGSTGWRLPVGLDVDRRVAALVLHPGEHALVAGPPRSGRSTTLCTLASRLRAAGVTVVALCPRPSPVGAVADVATSRVRELAAVAPVAELLRGDPADPADTGAAPSRLVVVIDDAELVDDDGLLVRLLDRVDPDLRVLVGAGAERLGARFGTWTAALTHGSRGLALRPDLDDHVTDLFGRRVPTGPLPAPDPDGAAAPDEGAGRGYLVQAGRVTLVQVAR